ncbi:TRAP transporter substrate-binding protein [Thorsellia kenyensis]|uniref:TRAP transporter substrate-binding protein DctP n=1 Tax=Thorsellia kenyensis TaxID=1549888 RepID=A0ABV6CFL3_9GAMM
MSKNSSKTSFIKKGLAALIGSVCFMSSAAMAADYTIIAPHVTSLDGYNHQSLLVFKNHVESRSNGAIEVEIYPSGQLCSSAKECISGVQQELYDYFQTTIPELANFWDPIGAFDLPYLLPDDRIAECVYDDEALIKDVRAKLLENAPNVRLMMVSNSGGWRSMATTKKQIKSPADVNGLKLRTVPAKIQQELVRTFGGSPTPLAWPEVYTALSTGVVDGTKNGVVDIVMNRFNESIKFITLDEHAYMGGAWVFNDAKFKDMPDNLKKIVIDGIAAQNQYLRAFPKHNEYAAYEEFKKTGGTVYNPSAEEKQAFIDASKPVRDFFLKESGEEGQVWLTRFEQTIANCKKSLDETYQYQLN